MTITALPTPPSRNDPSNFATRADAFLGALPDFATEANALAAAVNADEIAADASATAAASSASAAASSASSASSSASAASSSASAASASASAAAASYDSFDDRYLGAKSSDPSVDNDGNALLAGALYWNTTVGEMRVYSGTVWVSSYLTTGAQTISGVKTFSSNPLLSGGTADGVLYLNGSKVATSGSALTFDGTNFAASNQIIAGIGVATANVLARSNVSNGGSGFSQFLFGNASGDTRGFLSYSHASEAILFGTSSAEQMRLTSTGLGIGTSSPAYKLDVSGQGRFLSNTQDQLTVGTTSISAGASLTITSGNGTTSSKYSYLNFINSQSSTKTWRVGTYGEDSFVIVDGTTERLKLDSSGNLGLGVTPGVKLDIGSGTLRIKNATGDTSGLLILQDTSDTAKIINYYNGPLVFGTNNTERARITSGGNFKIGGTADRGTTEGDKQLVLFDGTAPVGTLTNGVSFYSASGEARVMDAAGNSTLLSPHDSKTNEWIFHSKHTPTGKVLRIDVERLLKFVNDHFGLDAVQEFIEP